MLKKLILSDTHIPRQSTTSALIRALDALLLGVFHGSKFQVCDLLFPMASSQSEWSHVHHGIRLGENIKKKETHTHVFNILHHQETQNEGSEVLFRKKYKKNQTHTHMCSITHTRVQNQTHTHVFNILMNRNCGQAISNPLSKTGTRLAPIR